MIILERLRGIRPKLTREQLRLRKVMRVITNGRISEGLIVRKPCQVCGNLKVESHHVDYRNPDVMFLCQKHHRDWHNRQSIFDRLRATYGMKFVNAPHQFAFKWVWVKNHMSYRPRPAQAQPSVVVRGHKIIRVI